MPDFTANIVLDIDDSKLKSVEDRLNNLEKTPINIKLDIDQSALNNVLNLSGSGIKSLSATGQKAGLKLGAGIQNGLKIATKVPVIKNGALKTIDQYANDVFQNNKNLNNEVNSLKKQFPKADEKDLLKIAKGYYSGVEKEAQKHAKAQEAVAKQTQRAKQSELKDSVAMLNAENKAKQAALSKNANFLMTEQLSLLDKISLKRAEIAKQEYSGNSKQAKVAKEELNNLRKQYSSNTEILKKDYSTLYPDRRAILKSKADESELKYQKAIASISDSTAKKSQDAANKLVITEEKALNKHANSLMSEQSTLLDKINSKRAEIAKQQYNGNFEQAKVAKLELANLNKQYKANTETLKQSQYSSLIPNRREILKSKANESELKYQGELSAILDSNSKKYQQQQKQQQKQINEYANRIRNDVKYGDYDALLSKMNKSMSKFPGLTDANENYKKAYDAYQNMQRINDKLKLGKHDDGTVFSSDDYAKFGKEFQGQSKLFSNSMSIISDEMSQAIDVSKRLKAQADISSLMDKNGRATKKYGTEMESLQQRAANLTTDSDYKQWREDFTKVKTGITLDGLGGNSVFSQLKKGLSSITRYIGISELLHASVNTAKQMVQAVREVDTAMTGLYKVTDNTKQEYDEFYKSAQKSAINLGRTTSSYIDQTATWAKLGYTLKDSAELAKTSSIYANVGEVDDATAVSDIVTALKAFNYEASDSIRVVDSLNQLGNRFAVSSADLGTGLAKSASAMAASGNDMYQTLAMLTGGGEITQNVGELGNALKVVSMRIMGQKGALEEIGEEYENIQEVSKIQGQIYNLTKGTVNIMDEANPTKFKSTYEILQGVANIIDDLNGTDRANLTEILFGKMRGNQGLAILNAFKSGQVQKAYEEAVNSAGSAQQEQDRWMESLDAKIQQFQSSFQNLSNTAISSDFLKGIVDGGTSALNILTQIIDKVGILKPLLAGFGAAAFFKNLDRPEITGVQANFPIS